MHRSASHTWWVFGGLCLLLSSLAAAPETEPFVRGGGEYDGIRLTAGESTAGAVILHLDLEAPRRQVSPQMLGFNWGWVWPNERIIEPKTSRIAAGFKRVVADYPIPLIRLAGTESQYFRWREAVGPIEQRQAHRINRYDNAFGDRVMLFGVIELLEVLHDSKSHPQLAYVLNFELDDKADHADLAELLVGDDKTNPNGGTNWAAVRVAAGFPEPTDVAVWELGNELDGAFHRESFPTVEHYIAQCRKTIEAVRRVDPDARFAAAASTAPWHPRNQKQNQYWPHWHRRVLEALGDDIDYLTFHPYYHGLKTAEIVAYLDQLRVDIRDITGSDRIRLFLSEHARWPRQRPDGGLRARDTHNLAACLAVAEFLNVSFADPQIAMMAYHNLNGQPWKVLTREKESGAWYANAMGETFRFYHDHLREQLVLHYIEGPGTDTRHNDLNVTALATADNGGLSVILVNRDAKLGRPLRITGVEGYAFGEAAALTGPELDAINTADYRPVVPRSLTLPNHPQTLSLHLPAKTILGIQLTPNAN